jgi:hypothetical protein
MTLRSKEVFLIVVAALCMAWHSAVRAQNSDAASTTPTPRSAAKPTDVTSAPAAAGVAVAPSETVITIKGLCDQAPSFGSDKTGCNTLMSRAQFEHLVNSINFTGQRVTSNKRRSFAKTYVQLLAFEKAARDKGLEETAEFAEILLWARLRAISEVYRSKLLEQSRTVTAGEIDAYYNQHLASYERVNIVRMMVPRKNPGNPPDKEFDQRALGIARAAYERFAKGEDPETVQKEAYAALGLSVPPSTKIGVRKRSDFIPEESEEVFSLKPGEVSKLETDVGSYTAYKVVARETLSKNEVQEEISREISQRKFKDSIDSVVESVAAEYNEAYFGVLEGTSQPPALPSPRAPH